MDTNQYYGWKPSFITYTTNLTQKARERRLDPVTQRDNELKQIISVLNRRTKNNPILIGNPGVGKTAIIEGLAQRIVANDVPKELQNKEILQLDFGALLAGTRKKGAFEQRLKETFADLIGTNNSILFIDDIHVILQELGQGVTVADMLKKYVTSGEIPLIGTTLTTEYRKYFDSNKSLERNFQTILIEEPNEKQAIAMLHALRPNYEKFHAVTLPDETLTAAVTLSKRYLTQSFLPDKAIDLLDEAAAEVKVSGEKKRKNRQVKKSDVAKIVSAMTKIPTTKLTKDQQEKILALEKHVHKKFVNQEVAVAAVSEAVRRGRIGLSSANRPIASFIFLGSSGVGKTKLAQVLAEVIFEQESALIQIDMSGYMQKQDVAKLLGAPAGYVGYEEGGILTEAVKKNPYSIVLLDNFDKAHSDTANILLQILDEGHVTDNRGNKVSFTDTIIICTTTRGENIIAQAMTALDAKSHNETAKNESLQLLKPAVKELLLKKLFSPELLNRFDDLVLFQPLSQAHIQAIVRLSVSELAALLKEQGITFQITERAVSQLAQEAYTPEGSARSVAPVLRKHIENPISKAVLSKKINLAGPVLLNYQPEKGFALSNNTSLQSARLTLPKIVDIALFDRINDLQKQKQIAQTYEVLKKLSDPALLLDGGERDQYTMLRNRLEQEKAIGDPTAIALLSAAEMIGQAVFPMANDVQVVTETEFEEARQIWEENYQQLITPPVDATQVEWIIDDLQRSEKLMQQLMMNNTSEEQQALRELPNILPFILLGGFTKEEMLRYLSIKIEAARNALILLEEEEDTSLLVRRHQIPETNTLAVSLEP